MAFCVLKANFANRRITFRLELDFSLFTFALHLRPYKMSLSFKNYSLSLTWLGSMILNWSNLSCSPTSEKEIKITFLPWKDVNKSPNQLHSDWWRTWLRNSCLSLKQQSMWLYEYFITALSLYSLTYHNSCAHLIWLVALMRNSWTPICVVHKLRHKMKSVSMLVKG